MSLDDELVPWPAAVALERGENPTRSPRNYEVDRDLYLEHLAEEIAIARDHVATLEAKYRQIRQVEVDHDPDPGFDRDRPGIDGRLFDLGTEVSEQWRPRAEIVPRPLETVAATGDRL